MSNPQDDYLSRILREQEILQLADFMPSEGEALPPTIHARMDVTANTPAFHAAIKVALREYETSRRREVDFSSKHVTDFAESVLANWSSLILGGS